ncbi:cytokinin hydroxylase-like [Dioscorea cayenensis subsp. rotundata]|uniref:Cytokinin hydroxylase-like n=1 Tax=Dioscorea cayennensis subsp. rotundata TaxID=55577 RepID=A0AB40D187_DIOCR|nr:cytokinin hydroxylase-like [Dioscorea cayenensis subsp. rotundata]
MGLVLVIFSLLSTLIFLRAAWITLSCYYLTPKRIKKIMASQNVSGPEPGFLVGNLTDIASLIAKSTSADMESIDHDIVGRLMPHYVLWSKIYGKRFMFWYGSEPRLCLTEIDMIKELLSSKYVHISGKSWLQQQGSKHFIGQGLLMANGDNWFRQRHVVAPAFMADKLKDHVRYMVDCTKKMIKALRCSIETGDDEVEISSYLKRLAGDIISRTEFDCSYEKGTQISHLLNLLQQLTAQSSRHLWFPGSRFFPSKFRREIKALKMEVERLLMEIIQNRKDCFEIARSSSYGKGLLAMLLAEAQKKREGFRYSLQTVMDECKTFFFAGHDTSALLLTWTIMLLSTNTSWQDKGREEVERVCGDEPPLAEHLPKLNMLQMIINESLRLYPPASLLPRMVFEDIKLGDLNIPKGLSIWIPVLAIHHSEDIWGKDVNEFNPGRFSGKSFAQTRYFMPFAAGPRNCVGQAYAMMEAKIILAMLLSNFSFSISKNYRHAPVNVLTLKPKHGVLVHLKPLRP